MKTRKTFQIIILLFAFLLSTLDSFGQIIKVYLENTGNETINVAYGYHYRGLFSEKSTYRGWYRLNPGDKHLYTTLGTHGQASIAFSKRGGYVIYRLKNANNKNIGVDGFYVNPGKSFEYTDGNYAKSYSPIMTSYRVAQAYCYKCEGQTLYLTLAVPSNTSDKVIPFENKGNKLKVERNKLQYNKIYRIEYKGMGGYDLLVFNNKGEVLLSNVDNF